MHRISRRARDDRGSALVAVIGLMAIGAVITLTLTAATLNSLKVTTSTRASVQARAAAEAGIDVAVAQLRTTDACSTDASGHLAFTPVSGVNIQSITISHDGTAGCPVETSTSVQIASTGAATAKGVAGASSGDRFTIVETYDYDLIITQVPLDGVAVYAYTVDGTLKKFQLDSDANSVATSVMIKTGDVECTNGASIGGDLVLGNGSAKLDMCDVAGSVHVSKDVTVNKTEVGGDVWAGGLATVTNSTVGGVVQSGALSPNVPNWVDVGYDPAHWAAQGYNVVNWTLDCQVAMSAASRAALESYTVPTVVNYLNKCPSTAVTTNNNQSPVPVKLKTDVVFFAKQFSFDKLAFQSATAGTAHTLSFIVPDQTANAARTCAPPAGLTGNISLTNETDFSPDIAAMVYTPCKIISDRNGFRGQLYGGEVEFDQQAQLTFVPVGIPGFDMSAGVTVPKVTGAELGDRLTRLEEPGVG
ncbi:hypothetical protein EEJ31_10645 [Cryobacterium tepidiphilum]|uniref:Uncharacterized protein n=2 Tax=Cryobacterium tepidiphilum TaxID=2486026 RepID=A0A3M8L3C7_9MICO|nr:hypothetical protein EEJ31_10645 [Cryobacterium tepidiphilum]